MITRQAFGRILAASLILQTVVLLAFATPADASAALWSAEPIPTTAGNFLGPAGVDIRDLAVAADGTTIYAAPGDSVSDNVVYESTDAGASWTTLGVSIEVDLVAIAPDNPDMVAIANTSTPVVHVTTDGGSSWNALGTPRESGGTAAAAIYDIAISKASDGARYIAVAGKEAGDVANVWYFRVGSIAPTWKETNTLGGFSSANVMKAVAFSPNFPSDKVMVAVGEIDNTSVDLQILSFSSARWNTSADFASYPVTVASDDGITDLTSASISLDPEYLGSDATRRIAFIGLTVAGDAAAIATSGIYRLNDYNKHELKTGYNIHSIDFDGARLIAGAYSSNVVYRSANPEATTPTVSDVTSLKRPGGENKVVAAWAGSKVVAGTSGDESAFSISRSNGASFNDVSLIDTEITNARDVAVSADGGKVYLVTDDGTALSLWSYAASWQRVLSIRNTINYIIRLAPQDANMVYIARKGTTTVYHSRNGGETDWFTRTCKVDVKDLAVESADILYALNSEGEVSKSTNAGYSWSTAVSTDLDSGATIVSVSSNNLLAGSQDGYVAYSTDGNSSWTRIPEVLEKGALNVQVIADSAFATNKIIYAASDKAGQNIKAWTIGTSTEWSDIFSGTLNGGIYGLAMSGGTLYALEFNTITKHSTLWQCLSPTTATSTSSSWGSKSTAASTDVDDDTIQLNASPRALKASSGGKMWAVKTNGTNKLYSFTAILGKLTLRAPADKFTNPVNAITGEANEIVFTWPHLSGATEYELYIAYDADFTALVATVTRESSDTDESTIVAAVGPDQAGDARVYFTAGRTYFWRVRITEPLYSIYSPTRSFTVEPVPALVPELLTPKNGGTVTSLMPSFSWSPVSGATEYRFVLADNVTLDSPIVDLRVKTTGYAMPEELDYGKTYYWLVKPVAPIEGNWSVLANFTVKEKPAEPVPPLIVEQAPPPVINLPQPPPSQPNIVISPPLPLPVPFTPTYIWAMIIIGVLLLLAVIALMFKPFRVVVYGDKLKKVKEALGNYFERIRPVRVEELYSGKADVSEEAQSIAFAAKSFLWMTPSEDKEGDTNLMSADEEQELGHIIALRIHNVAMDHLLYREFPEDATLFLYLWSRYGSRDETNRYLKKSFQSNAGNVIRFLKCYLPTSEGAGPGDFSRTQYDAVAKVVDADIVFEALKKLYGSELDKPDCGKAGAPPDKAIAYQFARTHHSARSEMKKSVTDVPASSSLP